jgi:hypothetical protein
MVNGETITAAQKENYRKGKEVQLADDTQFAYTAVDPQGIRANRIALIASILVDGGLTYVVYKGLNALFNQKNNQASETLSAAYKSAVAESKLYGPEGNNPMGRDWPHMENYQR